MLSQLDHCTSAAGAGSYHCNQFLQRIVTKFTVEVIIQVVHSPDEWPSWLQDQCSNNDWTHSTSPLIWRELLDRGGKGLYLGGLAEFEEFASHYYGITPHTDSSLEAKVINDVLELPLGVIYSTI